MRSRVVLPEPLAPSTSQRSASRDLPGEGAPEWCAESRTKLTSGQSRSAGFMSADDDTVRGRRAVANLSDDPGGCSRGDCNEIETTGSLAPDASCCRCSCSRSVCAGARRCRVRSRVRRRHRGTSRQHARSPTPASAPTLRPTPTSPAESQARHARASRRQALEGRSRGPAGAVSPHCRSECSRSP
jgi:hypothetical protein